MNIILIGFKNCGKTTLGLKLARHLNWHFQDTDELICKSYSKKFQSAENISTVFQALGEDEFRKLETEVIFNFQKDAKTIIATGGGSILNNSHVEHLKSIGHLVYLETPYDILFARTLIRPPAFFTQDFKASFDQYYYNRIKRYESVADFSVKVHLTSHSQTINHIRKHLQVPVYGE